MNNLISPKIMTNALPFNIFTFVLLVFNAKFGFFSLKLKNRATQDTKYERVNHQ